MEISNPPENQDENQTFPTFPDLENESDQDIPSSQKFPILKPTRSGFMPVLDLDISIDPGIDLISQFVDQHKEVSRYNQKQLFESFYSLFCVLSFESLSETHAKTNSFEACQLLAIEYQNTCQSFHQEGYFQKSLLKFFPATQIPLVILNQLTSIGLDAKGLPISLHRKYQTMSLKKEYADKMDQIKQLILERKLVLYLHIKIIIYINFQDMGQSCRS